MPGIRITKDFSINAGPSGTADGLPSRSVNREVRDFQEFAMKRALNDETAEKKGLVTEPAVEAAAEEAAEAAAPSNKTVLGKNATTPSLETAAQMAQEKGVLTQEAAEDLVASTRRGVAAKSPSKPQVM